ncbi:hypothetical protein BGX21_005739 [Mortierella sp. AD011]|nr:hypothetical protein BGX20_005599 [Mortierella sp. AD010]KAF9369953.1 hypothetical protein BGX21_005739 [Mortierella sp. AD011]
MPVYYAIRDACGIQDIIQDSVETLKGTRFTYRTFEPSEGVATVGMSRSGRIQAGLRYSQGGTSKYWLAEATNSAAGLMSEPNQFDPNILNHYGQQQKHSSRAERPPSLYFRDLDDGDDESDGIEELYDASKQLEFGDYNFPTIDVYDPKKVLENQQRQARRSLKKSKKREYPRVEDPLLSSENRLSGSSVFGKEGWSTSTGPVTPPGLSSSSSNTATNNTPPLTVPAREGCVDNVNGYIPEPKGLKSKRSSAVLTVDMQDLTYQTSQPPTATTKPSSQ